MTNVSRRSLAKGAAWSVPAVSLASAAPAMAASPFTAICPPAATVMKLQTGSAPSVAAAVAGDGTYSGGTYYTLGLGQWDAPTTTTNTGAATTGIYLNWGATNTTCGNSNGTSAKDAVGLKTADGKSYKGKLTLSTPVGCSPTAAGAGLLVNVGIQSAVPYNADVCGVFSNSMMLSCVSIPFSITYLTGLSNNYQAATNVCGYYLNMCFKPTGCQPNYSVSQSISSTPLY